MSSTNKTTLGLNMWEASDKPVRQDFVNDNTIIDDKVTQLSSKLDNVNSNLALKASQSDLNNTNVNLSNKSSIKSFILTNDKSILDIYYTISSSPAMTPFYIPSTYSGSSPMPETGAAFYGQCFSSSANNYCIWKMISGSTGTTYVKILTNGTTGSWIS